MWIFRFFYLSHFYRNCTNLIVLHFIQSYRFIPQFFKSIWCTAKAFQIQIAFSPHQWTTMNSNVKDFNHWPCTVHIKKRICSGETPRRRWKTAKKSVQYKTKSHLMSSRMRARIDKKEAFQPLLFAIFFRVAYFNRRYFFSSFGIKEKFRAGN